MTIMRIQTYPLSITYTGSYTVQYAFINLSDIFNGDLYYAMSNPRASHNLYSCSGNGSKYDFTCENIGGYCINNMVRACPMRFYSDQMDQCAKTRYSKDLYIIRAGSKALDVGLNNVITLDGHNFILIYASYGFYIKIN